MPFISAYLLLLIDEQVIQSVTNRNGITIRLIFSWAFQPLGLVLLPIFLASTHGKPGYSHLRRAV